MGAGVDRRVRTRLVNGPQSLKSQACRIGAINAVEPRCFALSSR